MNEIGNATAGSPAPTRLEIAVKNIEFARNYTKSLITDLSDEEWFWQPGESITHIAWQVGHIAMGQYGLALFVQRGRQPIDLELMKGKFRKKFFKGTTPSPDASEYPTVAEILTVLDRVYDQVMEEVPHFEDKDLDQSVEMPFAGYPTRYGALLFAADHEMLHAGQIGLVRRLMGKPPIR